MRGVNRGVGKRGVGQKGRRRSLVSRDATRWREAGNRLCGRNRSKPNPKTSFSAHDQIVAPCLASQRQHTAVPTSIRFVYKTVYRRTVYKNAHKKSRRKLFAYNGLQCRGDWI